MGGQLLLADSVLDRVAVTLGAIAAAAAWWWQERHLAATLATVGAVLWTGVTRRRR